MMPPIAMSNKFLLAVGDSCGEGVAVGDAGVMVGTTDLVAVVDRVAVGGVEANVGSGCVGVAVWVWVGICIRVAVGRAVGGRSGASVMVGGTDVGTTGVSVGGTDVGGTISGVGVSVLTRVGTV